MTQNSSAKQKILVVVTGANRLVLRNGVVHPTGYYLGELVEPLEKILNAGFDFDLATPGGIQPTMDADSAKLQFWILNRRGRDRALDFIHTDSRLAHPLKLESITQAQLDAYIGLLVPGGHGPIVDLYQSQAMASVLEYFHGVGKPTALICQGPAALMSLSDRKPWPYAGYSMTVYDNAEEKISEVIQLGGPVPFYPETELANLGGVLKTSRIPFTPKVVRDRELITGQNPYSPGPFGRALVSALNDYLNNGRLN